MTTFAAVELRDLPMDQREETGTTLVQQPARDRLMVIGDTATRADCSSEDQNTVAGLAEILEDSSRLIPRIGCGS